MSASPLILAIDTSTESGSIAVRGGGKTVAARALHSTDGFGHLIFDALEGMLAEARVQLSQIDCFAAASGPGSFTGVRVALATAKGLAEAMSKPAIGISNLRAMALCGQAEIRAVAIDARRGQYYGAVYDFQGKILVPETVAKWEDWLASVPAGAEFIGVDGQIAGIAYTPANRVLAPAIAEWAEIDGVGCWQDPVALDANYVRRSDAQMFWKDL